MNIDEVKKLKFEMEDKIYNELRRFSDSTGLVVRGIEVHHVELESTAETQRVVYGDVKAEVYLP